MSGFLKILFFILLLVYVVNPYDLLPDIIPIGGWIDDFSLVMLFLYYIRKGGLPGFFSGREKSSKTDQDQYGYNDRSRRFKKEKAEADSEQKAQTDAGDPYEILGIKPGAGMEEIQAAYRRAVQAYHPDKVSHLGKEFQDLAQEKFIEIQEAYEKLLKDNGKAKK